MSHTVGELRRDIAALEKIVYEAVGAIERKYGVAVVSIDLETVFAMGFGASTASVSANVVVAAGEEEG